MFKERTGMKNLAFWGIGLALLVNVTSGLAQNVSWTQYFFVARNIFPQANEICILLPQEEQEPQKKALGRAAAQFRFKVKLYLFTDARSIGSNLQIIPDGSILIVYDSPLTQDKSSMMYILSQAKDKNISVVTASEQYVDAGALVGLVKEAGHLRVVVNLKFSQQLAGKFTPEFNQKIGIVKVLQ